MKITHLIPILGIVFVLGFVANTTLLEGELPVELPILFASALFYFLASRNPTVAKLRTVLFALVLLIGLLWFIMFLQGGSTPKL